jgi:hypothetical protein
VKTAIPESSAEPIVDLLRLLLDPPAVVRARCDAAMLGPLAEFLRRPGKGLRRDLVEATYRIGGCNAAAPLELTARGGPSLHLLIGTPLAINAGNWLCFAAFALIDRLAVSAEVRARIHRAVNETVLACHAGQSLDLRSKRWWPLSRS